MKEKQTELRDEVKAEVGEQIRAEVASGPITELVEGLDKAIGTVGEATSLQLTAILGGTVPDAEP